jgi:hypothetical protein
VLTLQQVRLGQTVAQAYAPRPYYQSRGLFTYQD